MKKKVSIILGAFLLTIGTLAALAFSSSSKKEVEVKADYANTTVNGLYERIDDPSEVTPGTQVVLATTFGYVFNGVGGNPAYAHADPGGFTMFEDYDENEYWQDDTKFIWFNNKTAIILTAETGDSRWPGSVAFKSDFYFNGKKYSHYLGENDDGVGKYDGVAWFLDNFGVREVKDGKSSWELTFDSVNKKMLMRKVIYDDTTSYLRYNNNGARHHFCFGNAESACTNLYRKVDDSKLTRPIESMVPEVDPDKMTYVKGDLIEYEGVVVKWRIQRDSEHYNDYLLRYCDYTRNLFSFPPTVGENPDITFRIFNNLLPYTITVTIQNDASGYRYNLLSSMPADLRGTYLLSTENSRVLDASRETESTMNYESLDSEIFNNGYITANSADLDKSVIKIVRTKINDNYYYHAMNYLGEYLTIGSKVSNDYDDYYIDYTNTASVSNAVTITANSLKMGNYYLSDSEAKTKLICFTPINTPMHFFKLSESTSVVIAQVNIFIEYFEKKTKVCSDLDDPDFEKITDELWSDLQEEFEKLSYDAQGIFASTTYTHGTSNLGTKENVVDRYDYILAKYNKADFMLRKTANTYVNNYANPARLIINKGNTGAYIVIAVVAIFMTTTLCLFLLKKRKIKE